jgi:MFS family permease
MENKSGIKIGIYGIGILMMGVIGISGVLTTIGAHFPDASQTMIQNLISIPCLVVIPVTLIVGKLMDSVSKKLLALIGIICFLVGGFLPAFMSSLTIILVLRGILGIGIGIVQCVSSALVAENFEGPERDKVQGNLTSAQMLGVCVMVFAGGWLADISWNFAFYVHLLAVISLILCIVCVPNVKPVKATGKDIQVNKVKLNTKSWVWAAAMFVLFIGGQIYSIALSYIVDEKSLGTSAQSGNAMAFFAIGGFLLGLVFGKLSEKAKDLTLFTGLCGIIISYLIIAFAGNMPMIYLGAFLFGVSLSVCMPCIIVGTAGSVDAFSSAMAISITMCAQNFAQFLCPYIINPISAALGDGTNTNQISFLIGAVITAVMAVAAFVWGIRQKRS